MEEIRKYPFDFFILFSGLAVFVWLFIISLSAPAITRKYIFVSAAFYYFWWGVIHHLIRRDFCWRVFLEYLFLALLCGVIALFVINWD